MTADVFKRLFLPFHPKLYRIAFALVGNQADAEDLLQEAYSKLWLKRKELETLQNPEAFCVTLVKNLCLDFLRSPKANRHEEDVSEAYQVQSDSSPERQAEEKEKLRNIRQWIHQLPESQQQVLRLHSFEDCSMEEIEKITGFNAGNIRVLLFRARKTIREQFNKLYGNG